MQQQTDQTAVAARRRPKIFYGWYIVAAGTISGFLNVGIFVEGLSLFVKDVRDQLGWSVTAISLGFSIRSLESGVLSPFSGYLIDRLGPRVMAIAGTVMMGIGLLVTSQMHSLWQFYLSGMIIALGQGMGGTNGFMAATMHWFYRKRGRASALLAMGRGWGYILVLPLSLLLVAFGWRWAAGIAAITFMAVSIPLAMLLRHKPEPYGYYPDGASEPPGGRKEGTAGAAKAKDSFSVLEALKSRPFWMLMIANLVYSFATQVQHVHMITHLRNVGFSAASAAGIIAIYGGTQVVGRLVAGWVGDKVRRNRLMMFSFVLMALGWITMAHVTPSAIWTVVLFYLTFGAGQAAHTVVSGTIVADFFGPNRYATIRGFISPIAVLGGVMGPLFAGVLFDALGSYRLALTVLGPITMLGFFALLLAGKPTLSGEDQPRKPARA